MKLEPQRLQRTLQFIWTTRKQINNEMPIPLTEQNSSPYLFKQCFHIKADSKQTGSTLKRGLFTAIITFVTWIIIVTGRWEAVKLTLQISRNSPVFHPLCHSVKIAEFQIIFKSPLSNYIYFIFLHWARSISIQINRQ